MSNSVLTPSPAVVSPVPGAVQAKRITAVEIAVLSSSDSPRGGRRDEDHVAALLAALDDLPPILVHSPTMCVIDGMHRLWAMQLAGRTTILVELFEGDADEAFGESVRRNGSHGLPLTRKERKAAVTRILIADPQQSDRAVASMAGLSATTVASIRSGIVTSEPREEGYRTGQDGRRRPMDPTAGRLAAQEYQRSNPKASLREVAAVAGVSPSTASAARKPPNASPETAALSDSVTDRAEPAGPSASLPSVPCSSTRSSAPDRATTAPTAPVLRSLSTDPSLRGTEAGRLLLRLLHETTAVESAVAACPQSIPEYRRAAVADLASRYARLWQSLADALAAQAGP